ncbi:MAG: hypothetical protein ACK4V6_14630 [Microthrixaceae bacterium]
MGSATEHAVRRRGPTLLGAVAALGVLVAGGCGIGWHDQQISAVEVHDDDRTLLVGYHCELDASVEVEETPEEVRLTFRAYGSTGNDCATSEEVLLADPLAGRRLVDTSNGSEITPCRRTAATLGDGCR